MKKALAAVILVAIVLSVAPAALADDNVCEGGSVTGLVEGNVVVKGVGCTILGAQITGNVLADEALYLVVTGSTVGGSVQAKKTAETVSVTYTKIGGDLQVEENAGLVVVTGAETAGNLQAYKNLGGVFLTNNTAGGNMQCVENDPVEMLFGTNTAGGNMECGCAE